MNLPFTPTSFKKLDILQQLEEYESEKGEKTLWSGVKAVLVWGASIRHQHLGSYIGINHVKQALEYCVEIGFVQKEEINRIKGSSRHILESLPTYGFGEAGTTPDPEQPSIHINRDGILAGRVLTETRFLKNARRTYNFWLSVWWLVLAMAGIILFSQTVQAIKDITKVFSVFRNETIPIRWIEPHVARFCRR